MGSIVYGVPEQLLERSAPKQEFRRGAALVSVLTVLSFLVNGYHPFTEDGGIYLASVRHLVDPALYPHDLPFVTAPTRFSIFGWLVAGLVRASGLPGQTALPAVALVLHLGSIWATLWAAWLLACRCWKTLEARAGALLLLACWLGLPLAGTSLLLMDPYLTARSFSTPCLLFAIVCTLRATATASDCPGADLDRHRRSGMQLWGLSIVVATLLHPLMAAYAVEASVILACVRASRGRTRWLALGTLTVGIVCTGAILNAFSAPESPQYLRVVLSRPYWFLGLWKWFELTGIIGPILLLALLRRRARPRSEVADLSFAAIAAAMIATTTSLLLVHVKSTHHLIARLQPMRELQFVYLVMILALGAWLGRRVLGSTLSHWVAAAIFLAAPLYAASRIATPNSRHIELPGQPPRNAWVQAFLWIRDHTPADALFALPPDYVGLPGEDAQCFRPIAQRSALADYSKDGGEASIAPQLTTAWFQDQAAEADLLTATDQRRRAELLPLGVTWVVLPGTTRTSLPCPYRSSSVAVCRLQ